MPRRLLAVLLLIAAPAFAEDPLASWNDGAAKQAITAFVQTVTREGGAGYVPPNERIAVFDHDGTLWSEKPWVGGMFLEHLIRVAAGRDPSLADRQPYRAALANDRAFFEQGGFGVMRDAVYAIRKQLDQDAFAAEARRFISAARHPELGVPFRDTVYQPALELLDYLRANGFRTFICSGGEIDFMRAFTRDFYGFEPYEVIGTSYRKKLQHDGDRWDLRWTGELGSFNNRDDKAVNIGLHIGIRPLLVMGNAGGAGDIGMMRYSQGRDGPSLQLMIDHDDAEREFLYKEEDNASLNAARESGWVVVSMKKDWAVVHRQGGTRQ